MIRPVPNTFSNGEAFFFIKGIVHPGWNDGHDLALDRSWISIVETIVGNSAYSNDIMAYDHEAVDSFVKGRDNKPHG